MKHCWLLVVMALCACATAPSVPSESPRVDTAHNSRNSLDWTGTYTGVVPCADCEGIETTVTLFANGRFTRVQRYLGESRGRIADEGSFTWDDAGGKVSLRSPKGPTQAYQVGENRLIHLDRHGRRIRGDLAPHYELDKAH